MSDTSNVFEEALQGLGTEYGFEVASEVVDSEVESEELEIVELEAEAESEEVEGDEDEEASDEPADSGPVSISEDMQFQMPDGTIVEAKDLILRQADYTRKTQALAEERKQLEMQLEELSGSTEYVDKLASAWEDNPVGVISGFLADTDDPTTALAQTIVELAKTNLIDPKFLETFGITSEVQQKWSEQSKRDSEIADLRRRLDHQELERQHREEASLADREMQEMLEEYERQWERVVRNNDLSVDDIDSKISVLEYARDNQITNLEKAYGAWRYEQIQAEKTKKSSSAKKRATGAVSKTSSSKPTASDPKPGNVEDAAWAAFHELTSGKGK